MAERRCRACGCTQLNACAGGCWWVAEDLCSSCGDRAAPAPRRAWSEPERRTIRRLAKSHTARQIAVRLGRTPAAVHQQAYRLRIQLQKHGDRHHTTQIPDHLVEQVRAMHDAGKKPAAIARETGIAIGNVKAFVYFANRHAASIALVNADQHLEEARQPA